MAALLARFLFALRETRRAIFMPTTLNRAKAKSVGSARRLSAS